MPRIAALLTCHNRKDKTLACLTSLVKVLPEVDIFLTDDGCTDGTAEAVTKLFSSAKIVMGTGELYWSRGMYVAWSEAIKQDYDCYLWLNDDVVLYANFFDELSVCSANYSRIVSGLVEDSNLSRIIYGGYDEKKQMIQAADEPQQIRWMNGNVVLVPRSVVEKIGILDPYYQHDLGDVDYGMRAREQGIEVVSTRVAVASGEENDVCRIRKAGVSLVQRFYFLNSPLGSPLRINFYFRRRHFGFLHASAYLAKLILINLLPDKLYRL